MTIAAIRVRPASVSDTSLLFGWRNDPLTRTMSRDQEPVEWERHVQWLTARLGQPEPHLFVAVLREHPVGTIRVDGAEVSYTVSPDHRGRGVATAMLAWARQKYGVLVAEVKSDNIASIKAAKRAGHRVVVLREP